MTIGQKAISLVILFGFLAMATMVLGLLGLIIAMFVVGPVAFAILFKL